MTQMLLLLGASVLFLVAIIREERKGNMVTARLLALVELVLLIALFWGDK